MSIISKIMNSDISRTIVRKANRGLLLTKKFSPEIYMALGTVMAVGTVIAVHKAAVRAQIVLQEAKENMDAIKECSENEEFVESGKYTEEDATTDKMIVYTSTAKDLAKLYFPAVLLGVGSLSMFYASIFTLKKRHAAAAALAVAFADEFKQYRNRVVEQLGSDADKRFKYGLVNETIKVKETDANTGEEREIETEVSVVEKDQFSDIARIFDETNPNYKRDPQLNLSFLKGVERYMNERLRLRGHLFLNEVYDALDIPRTTYGQCLGWIYDKSDNTLANRVDFGLYNIHNRSSVEFVNGYEAAVILDFNVDGEILNLI